MNYAYVAYTEERKLVKGKVAANSEEAATNLLSYANYDIISIKPVNSFFQLEKPISMFSRVSPKEVVIFSRQLALLLESGTDIVASLQLLQNQSTNATFKKIVGEVASDIRGGSSLSVALGNHPRAFSQMYSQVIAAGEQGGNLEVVLRQVADYIERGINTEKKIKGAMTYPVIVVIVALIVLAVLTTFVFPTFISLYATLGVKLPGPTEMMINILAWSTKWGIYVIGALFAALIAGFIYARTPAGKHQWHKIMLRLPIIGRILLLSELARCCRITSLLFQVGLPLGDILGLAIRSSTNQIITENLTEVQEELIRGEGLSRPMAKRKIFLPLMVQMVSVGEETGNLDGTLTTVAQSYESESADRIDSAIALIQPAITILIGIVVGFVALSLVSAMYSMYSQVSF